MRIILIILLFALPNFAEDFITPLEYAKMLYENPRGIGCHKCHGKKGEGKVIAKYKEKGKVKKIVAPSINNIRKKRFMAGLSKNSKVMPTYFLTKEEIESLYYYMKQSYKKVDDETQ